MLKMGYTVRVREVGGSNPPTPTGKNGTSSREEVPFLYDADILCEHLTIERTVLFRDTCVDRGSVFSAYFTGLVFL